MPSHGTRTRRRVDVPLLEVFEPSRYNWEELEFIETHLGENPRILIARGLPRGVNPRAVDEVLGSVYEYSELARVDRANAWCGPAPIKRAIAAYRTWRQTSERLQDRLGIAHPSFYTWTSRGEGIRGAVGSDSQIVRSVIEPGGSRKRLGVRINRPADTAGLDETVFIPDFAAHDTTPTALIERETQGHLECPICHWVTNYDPDNRKDRTRAIRSMRGHLQAIKKDRNAHRALLATLFQGTRTEPEPSLAPPTVPPSPEVHASSAVVD